MNLAWGWLVIVTVWAGGAFWEGFANATTVDPEHTEALNTATSGLELVGIDDATLDAGPLNTELGGATVLKPAFWRTIWNLFTFNYSFLGSYAATVRYFLLGISGAIALGSAFQNGPTILSAVRGVFR